MNVPGPEAAPFNAVAQELESLRETVRATLESYGARIDAEILRLSQTVKKESGKKKISSAKMHNMRDMLTLLRTQPVKPEKGRRKDLKRLDSLVGDLAMLTENW